MNSKLVAGVGAAVLVAGVIVSDGAKATEGYFLGGYGVIQSGLSGAGVANSEDAMSISLNPAGIAGLDRQVNLGAALFLPDRGYTGTNTGFVAPGVNTSGTPYFIMPNAAYSAPIDATSAWGVALYGNGGSNTDYSGRPNPNCGGALGTYCAGHAGQNLMQVFLQFDYAQRFGNFSVGVSPVLAAQMFSAYGLKSFAGYSSSAAALSDNGNDYSFGAGLHAGVEWRVTPGFRIGLLGATETYMSKFSNYVGLFANQGSFDIPAWVDAGVALDVNPTITLLADYKHIFYSKIPAIADSAANLGVIPLGATNGPGFGWSDVDIVAVAAEFKATPDLTLRGGAEFNTNPVNSQNVVFNVIAPGVTTSQFSAGASYRLSPRSTLDLAGYVAPTNTLSGPDGYGGTIKLSLSEVSLLAGWTYHFDAK